MLSVIMPSVTFYLLFVLIVAMLNIIVLIVVMLNIIVLSVVMLNVVAPFNRHFQPSLVFGSIVGVWESTRV